MESIHEQKAKGINQNRFDIFSFFSPPFHYMYTNYHWICAIFQTSNTIIGVSKPDCEISIVLPQIPVYPPAIREPMLPLEVIPELIKGVAPA